MFPFTDVKCFQNLSVSDRKDSLSVDDNDERDGERARDRCREIIVIHTSFLVFYFSDLSFVRCVMGNGHKNKNRFVPLFKTKQL